nr:hypothetical protein [Tanacetum cinerariifolium]GEY79839.1 hypothetical protein [Tanacetum cinerariifolium]
MQTQTSNTLHNAIMEAGGKDRPPMLASGNYVQWKSRIKRYIDTKPNQELIHYGLKNPPYKFTWADKEVIITKGIDNDIYSTVDACPNVCEMWKAIERLKQGESINIQDLETKLYWEFRKFTSRDGKSLESYYSRFYKMMNELVRNQCDVTNHQVNVQFLLQLQPEWKDDEMSKDKEIDKLTALISLSFKKIYKPTNNNLRTSSNTSRANQDNSPRINKGTYAVDDSGPIFDSKPLKKVSNDDNYNVFSIESEHPEQSKSVHDTYQIEQDAHNVIIDSLDMSYDSDKIDHDDDDDLANEHGKSASTLIDTEKPLLKDPDGEDVDVHTYRSMIGSLMYLTSSRPDVMFVVCACVVLSGMESLKRMLHVNNILSAGSLTSQQMVLNSPCLTHIKNWPVQIKRSLAYVTAVSSKVSAVWSDKLVLLT